MREQDEENTLTLKPRKKRPAGYDMRRREYRRIGTIEMEGILDKSEISYPQLLQEVRRISMGGVMCTEQQFNLAKPTVWPNGEELCRRFDIAWGELAIELGLKVRR